MQPVKFTTITTIQPWGNSLGLRITRTLSAMVRLKKGSKVSIEVVDGGFLVKPAVPPKRGLRLPYTEAELVKDLTPFKAHADELPVPLAAELGP